MIADAVRMIRHCQSDQPGESLHLCVISEIIYSSLDRLRYILRLILPPAAGCLYCAHTWSVSKQPFPDSFFFPIPFQLLVCDLCVLCLSLRQRGDRGRQCRGESQRSIPAHYRQSADAFRTVAQAGATCVKAPEYVSQRTQCNMSHICKITVPAEVSSGL